MPPLPTVEIRSPKNPDEMWIINEADFDASTHVRWGEDVSASEQQQDDAKSEPEEQATEEVVQEPSVDDFIQDHTGAEFVNIIDPDNARRRKRIPASEYDPDAHRLWSTHPRFHQG